MWEISQTRRTIPRWQFELEGGIKGERGRNKTNDAADLESMIGESVQKGEGNKGNPYW